MATEAEELAEFLSKFGDAAPTTDAGPGARRAVAGMAPGPRMDDPSPSPPLVSPDILGRPRAQAPIYPIRPGVPTDLAPGMRTRPQTDMEGDPLAASVAGGLMGYGAGKAIPVAGAAASPFMRALQRVTTGAVEGEVASDATGGRPGTGAAVGAVAGAAGAAGAGRAAREDKALFREIGRAATPKAQEKITNIGADDIVATARDMGFPGAKDWTTRAQLSGAAKQKVGAAIGDAYKAIDQSQFGARPIGQVIEALEGVKAKLGQTTEGQQLARVVTEKQEALKKMYGGGDALDKGRWSDAGNDPAVRAQPRDRRPGIARVLGRPGGTDVPEGGGEDPAADGRPPWRSSCRPRSAPRAAIRRSPRRSTPSAASTSSTRRRSRSTRSRGAKPRREPFQEDVRRADSCGRKRLCPHGGCSRRA
jgi:hypothetical protein